VAPIVLRVVIVNLGDLVFKVDAPGTFLAPTVLIGL